jgi:hypothetical protein
MSVERDERLPERAVAALSQRGRRRDPVDADHMRRNHLKAPNPDLRQLK